MGPAIRPRATRCQLLEANFDDVVDAVSAMSDNSPSEPYVRLTKQASWCQIRWPSPGGKTPTLLLQARQLVADRGYDYDVKHRAAAKRPRNHSGYRPPQSRPRLRTEPVPLGGKAWLRLDVLLQASSNRGERTSDRPPLGLLTADLGVDLPTMAHHIME